MSPLVHLTLAAALASTIFSKTFTPPQDGQLQRTRRSAHRPRRPCFSPSCSHRHPCRGLIPALPAGHSRKPGDPISLSPAETLKSSRGSADACVDEDEIDAMSPTPSLVHFVLGNFAFAMTLISLIVFIAFFAVTWLTVLRDARSMRDQVLSNAAGVSLSFCFNGCALLTVVVAVGINTRPWPSTGP
jgi:hypothetical protein